MHKKFDLWDVVKDKDSGKIFLIRLMRVHPYTGKIQYGTGAEASMLYTEDELEMVSKALGQSVMENPCMEIALDTTDMYRVRVPGEVIFNTDGRSIPRKGFQLIKKTCIHKWKGIAISNTKVVFDCELCGIKKEDA